MMPRTGSSGKRSEERGVAPPDEGPHPVRRNEEAVPPRAQLGEVRRPPNSERRPPPDGGALDGLHSLGIHLGKVAHAREGPDVGKRPLVLELEAIARQPVLARADCPLRVFVHGACEPKALLLGHLCRGSQPPPFDRRTVADGKDAGERLLGAQRRRRRRVGVWGRLVVFVGRGQLDDVVRVLLRAQVAVHDDVTPAVLAELGPDALGHEAAGSDARGPDQHAELEGPSALELQLSGPHLGHLGPHDLDPLAREAGAAVVPQPLVERAQDVAPLDESDRHLRNQLWVLPREVLADQVVQLRCELHAGRAAANDDEREQPLTVLLGRAGKARHLEVANDGPPNCPRVGELLQEQGVLGHAAHAKRCVAGSDGNHERVVVDVQLQALGRLREVHPLVSGSCCRVWRPGPLRPHSDALVVWVERLRLAPLELDVRARVAQRLGDGAELQRPGGGGGKQRREDHLAPG
mmetsp:Transcript_4966/g.21283  ORF Transcript_4966/g.21283 Transcript_4966/m.21283 type:complete len:464 (+) Transcript_4966:117-1508(+)